MTMASPRPASTSARPSPSRSLVELTALLGFMMSLSAFSTDGMLPALHDLAVFFGVSDTQAQLVVNLYFFGFAVGQLFFGPLSDRFGRRRVLLVSTSGFLTCALALVVAPTFTVVLTVRFIQGLFGAALRSVGTALVRDFYRGEAMARVLSFALMVLLIAPVFAPSIGVFLLRWGWRAPFSLIAVLAGLLLAWLTARLPESLPPERRRPLSFTQLAAAARLVLNTPPSLALTAVMGCSYGILYAYLTSAAQLYREHFQFSNTAFALAFAGTGLGQVCGTFLNGLAITRLGLRRVLPWAVGGVAVAAAGLLVAGLLGAQPVVYWFLLTLVFFGIALVFSNANSAALEPLGEIAGFASSVIGFTSTVMANLFGLVIGQAAQGGPRGFALGIMLLALGSLASLLVAQRAGWGRERTHAAAASPARGD
ncbi:multidrug effflux MFS transporter [Thermorudis peleae]|uniref:multidrug effflux MFS transporter n=1 Tax=Thermorudis peleae TaxID=1382356 RepID=UPI00068C6372|nr:multidrug effflux MFS transporter [Thermorudis peleae]